MTVSVEPAFTNIAEMIDLAIGTPEKGTVDFIMLHTVLHCLAQQIRCTEKTVEVRGPLAVFPVGRQAEDAPTIVVNEFLIQSDGKDTGPEEGSQTILVAERLPKNQRVPLAPPATEGAIPLSIALIEAPGKPAGVIAKGVSKKTIKGPTKKDGSKTGTESGYGGETAGFEDTYVKERGTKEGQDAGPVIGGAVARDDASDTGTTGAGVGGIDESTGVVTGGVMGESIDRTGSVQRIGAPATEMLSIVSLTKFNQLRKSVDDLKSHVYGTTPTNAELLEGVRSQTNVKGITEMWTSLNVSSRLEAAEAGIAKLSSLMQDLVGKEAFLEKEVEAEMTETSTQAMETASNDGESIPKKKMPPECATKDELAQMLPYLQFLNTQVNQLSSAFYDTMKELGHEMVKPSQQEMALPTVGGLSASTATPAAADGTATPVGTQATTPLTTEETTTAATPDDSLNEKIGTLSENLKNLERKINEIVLVVFPPNGNILTQLNALQEQVDQNIRLQIAANESCSEKTGGGPSPQLLKELQGLMVLHKTVHNLQNHLKEVHETALQLTAEKEERQLTMDSLLEQVELLKTIKMDREDLAVALADKADVSLLAYKVSHDRLEHVREDLAKGLEQTIGKLNIQESLWQQALDDIQREIESKLDKGELGPIKEFVLKKMRQLQDSLKQMADLRREAQAAGTKSKLLKDVNCISCDAKAYMLRDGGQPSHPQPLQPHTSIKPYLTYELDNIRKAQASSVPHRNMQDYEKNNKQMTPGPLQKVRSDTGKHLCNRYCGGSHTMTTPAQRVSRLGHFVKQWGPDVVPLASEFATGDDGRIYKVSAVENVAVGPGGAVDGPCTPKPAKKSKKPSITPECRCIDEMVSQK